MSAAATPADDHLIVARIRRAHGIKGEVQISIDTDRPSAVFRRGRKLIPGDPAGEASGSALTIDAFRPTPTGGILKLAGVDSREGAEALRGRTLLIPAGEAQPAAPGEVHYRDLVGMVGVEGEREIGTVEDILELPVGEILVLRSAEGKEVLIPFVRELVRGVDRRARRLSLELPPGLLDL